MYVKIAQDLRDAGTRHGEQNRSFMRGMFNSTYYF